MTDLLQGAAGHGLPPAARSQPRCSKFVLFARRSVALGCAPSTERGFDLAPPRPVLRPVPGAVSRSLRPSVALTLPAPKIDSEVPAAQSSGGFRPLLALVRFGSPGRSGSRGNQG